MPISTCVAVLSLWVLLCLPLGACGTKPPPSSETVTTVAATPDAGVVDAGADEVLEATVIDASEPLPPAETPEDVAARWLESLRRADPALLDTWSRYPFFLHDTGDEGTCGQGAASDAEQLPRLLGCILHNEPLLGELRSQAESPLLVLKAKDLPAWARRWRNEIPNGSTLVLLDIAGHGNASHFVLIVRDGGVAALWKQTVFEQN